KLRIETAFDGGGVLGDVDQRLEKRRIVLDGHARQFLADFLAALLGGENYVVIAQPLLVVRRRDGDFLRAQPSMSRRQRPGVDARQLERYDFLAKKGNNPADGTDEAGAALDRPIHRLGEVDIEDDAWQPGRENVLDGFTGYLFGVGVIFALGSGF